MLSGFNVCLSSDVNIVQNKCVVLGENCIIYGNDCIVVSRTCKIAKGSNSRFLDSYCESKSANVDQKAHSSLINILEELGNHESELSVNDDDECSVCMDMKKDVVFLPCRHLNICTNCLRNIVHTKYVTGIENIICGTCRCVVENVIRFY